MNCDLAHDMLQQSLDGTPIESPEWLAHLRQCRECRVRALTGRRLQEGLQLLPAPLPPADLAIRIIETIRLECRRARRRTRRRWAGALAVAAVVLLALGLRLGWRERPAGTTSPPPESMAKNTSTPKEQVAPTLGESAAELKEIFAALSNQTADETVGQTRRWVESVPSPSLPRVDLTAIEPSTQPWLEAGEGMSEGLQPVTESARRAVDLFLRELPMDQNN